MKKICISTFVLLVVVICTAFYINNFNDNVISENVDQDHSFIIAPEVASVLDFWKVYDNKAYAYQLMYPNSWKVNTPSGDYEPETYDDPAQITIGYVTVNVYGASLNGELNCSPSVCEYYHYGYGEQKETGTSEVLDEKAVWEIREASGHNYYNVVFKKFEHIYSISFLHTSSDPRNFEDARKVYDAIIALFNTDL